MNEHDKSIKLKELLNNEQIMTEIANTASKEAMRDVFSRNGLEMTMAEIDAFIQIMNSDTEGEISENELDAVAGGVDYLWVFSQAITGIKKVAKACWKAGRWFANNVG